MGENEMATKAGTSGKAGSWTGVIRVDGDVVWSCGHHHRNRDHSTYTSGRSAHSCASFCLDIARNPQRPASLRRWANLSTHHHREFDSIRSTLAQLEYAETQADAIRLAINEPLPKFLGSYADSFA